MKKQHNISCLNALKLEEIETLAHKGQPVGEKESTFAIDANADTESSLRDLSANPEVFRRLDDHYGSRYQQPAFKMPTSQVFELVWTTE